MLRVLGGSLMQAHPACQLHAWEGPGFSHCTGEPPSATPSHPEPHTLYSSILALIASARPTRPADAAQCH